MLKSLLVEENYLRQFIEEAIPELKNDEVLIILLAARKKYFSKLTRSQEVVARSILRRNDAQYIIGKIKRLAVSGCFFDQDKPIPPKALVAYIDLNPKSTIKAFNHFAREVLSQLYIATTGNINYNYFKKLDVKLFSAIHKSNTSDHPYWCIDIDQKNLAVLQGIITFINPENVVWVSETRNGYHVIVRRNAETGEKLFRYGLPSKLKENVELKKEALTPIPGTLQGGFLVKPVNWRELK